MASPSSSPSYHGATSYSVSGTSLTLAVWRPIGSRLDVAAHAHHGRYSLQHARVACVRDKTEFLEVSSMSEFVTKQIVAAQTLVAKLRERAEEGQGMVEYALILAFIAILVIVALKFLQPAISNTLNNVSNSL